MYSFYFNDIRINKGSLRSGIFGVWLMEIRIVFTGNHYFHPGKYEKQVVPKREQRVVGRVLLRMTEIK